MIEQIKQDICEIKISIQQVANHYSKRLPLGITIIITLLTSLCVGLIVRGVYIS